MSQENVDFVLGAYARFNAGERVPELWFWHPDAEFQAAREDPDSPTHTGIEAIRKQWARWLDVIGHGAASGAPLEMELAHVYTFRDGRATRCVEYFDRAEALEA